MAGWTRLTATDVTDGWTIHLRRKDRTTFLASDTHPMGRVFFETKREAYDWLRGARAHGLVGRPVRARIVFHAEG